MRSCLFSFLFLLVSTSFAQSWQTIDAFPSTERDDGCVFVIGNKAYCGTGLAPWWSPFEDFNVFDMDTDSWDSIASLPTPRQYACAFANDSFGFVFGGAAGGPYLNDLWQYDPNNNQWTAKDTLPGLGRFGSACFVIDSFAYILGGNAGNNQVLADVWSYNMYTHQWKQKSNFPFDNHWRASATNLNGKGYLLFGRNENNSFQNTLYEYDPTLDQWAVLDTFPLNGRSHATMVSMEGNLLLTGGIDSSGNYYDDLWRYILSSKSWEQLNPQFSSGRKGGLCFNNKSTLYYTTGIDANNVRLKESWKCHYPTSIQEQQATSIHIYPNPVKDDLYIDQHLAGTLVVYSSSGAVVLQEYIPEGRNLIRLSHLPNGLYLLRLHESTWKLIKE